MDKIIFSCILLAAGESVRIGLKTKKPFLIFDNKPVLAHSLKVFDDCENIKEIIIVSQDEDKNTVKDIVKKYKIKKVKAIASGKKNRQESVYSGVRFISNRSTHVLIHDAARPLVTREAVKKVTEALKICDAVSISSAVDDTVKELNSGGFVKKTLDRDALALIGTPQAFEKKLYFSAFSKAISENKTFTDDCQLIENFGEKVLIIKSSELNFKITRLRDLEILEAISKSDKFKMRIGQGYDLHRLVKGKRLILGGVTVPHNKGLIGHSDADVLVHAIIDSILGAANFGDIGKMFPDTEEKFKNANSIELLEKVIKKIKNKNLKIQNIDCTIIAQSPKLSKFTNEMQKKISDACKISKDSINIKCKTRERLGDVGQEKAIEAFASCLIST